MATKTISINRAPVLTLWAAVVAERLGYDEDAALTLGRGVAALNAQSKGRRLGIFKAPEQKREKPAEASLVEVCGRTVPTRETARGVRAVLGGKVVGPDSVRRYVQRAFGDDLGPVRSALRKLAASFEPGELERASYGLYEQFRPAVPADARGWGAKGELDLGVVRRLTRRRVKPR